jgi:hypothetical protein
LNALVKSIEAEYRRYKALGDAAIEQVPEDLLSKPGPGDGNSLAILCWHVSGNLKSRFTDFLDSDGEKPWRERDEEFAERSVSRDEFLKKWEEGWDVLFATLGTLKDEDLPRTVQIRKQDLLVHEALHRSLAHVSYHVGQIVYIAHAFRGTDWRYLSIPPGGSAAYNTNPSKDKPNAHAESVSGSNTRTGSR